jgi:hypothetical protein
MSRAYYATEGKPLSQTALYQQRLRSGVYSNPGSNVGVNSNASDTAALLAASADLTVKPTYERTIAQEAQDAATAAKVEKIKAWSKGSSDIYADAAAASSLKASNTFTKEISDHPETGIHSFNSDKIYKAANKQSTSTMTSRVSPDKDLQRSGLVTKSSNPSINISKINQVASKNSSKSLNSRFNPELDQRSGLSSRAPPSEYLDQDEEDLAAASASASLKQGGKTSSDYSNQKRYNTFTASSVVNANLLAAANKSASDRLKSISSGTPEDFKAQAQLYANALAIAHKNSQERIKNNVAGVIDLGGGLTMTQAELDKLASTVVAPVLSDLDVKAKSQREVDQQKSLKHQQLVEEHQRTKRQEELDKEKEREERNVAKNLRITENENKKREEDSKFLDYQNERQTEVEQREQELKETQDKHAESKAALLEEKQANQDRIDSEETELIKSRKDELDAMQAEKDEILKPTLDELAVETEKLKELTNARDELKTEFEASEATNKEYNDKIGQLEKELEDVSASIEKYTEDLASATAEQEKTSKEVSDLNQVSIDELKKADEEHKELDANLAELQKTKDEHLATKAQQKEEIKKQLDEKVKTEHKINDELPEHLRVEVNEKKLTDTSSLFTVEEPVKAAEPVEKAEQANGGEVDATAKGAKENASSAKKVAPEPSPKKRSGLKRLSSIFKSKDTKKPEIKVLQSTAKTVKVEPTEKTTVEEPKKASVDIKNTKAESSNSVYDDDISLSTQKNQGGLFKEEI